MAYTAEEKAAMAARNDPEQDQESLAEGASIPSSANQTNELHDPNFKSETFLHTLGKTAQERHESILANRHEKAEWNVETFDEFQKLSVANQKMAWTLHKNILRDYLALAEDSNSILAEKDDAILQLQELIQSNEQQITEQQTIQKYLEKQTQQALKNEPGHHSHSRLSARIPDPPILHWQFDMSIQGFDQTLQTNCRQQKKFSNFWKKSSVIPIEGTQLKLMFWAEFQRLTTELDYSEETLLDDLRFKVNQQMQKALVAEVGATTLHEFAKKCMLIDQNIQRIKEQEDKRKPKSFSNNMGQTQNQGQALRTSIPQPTMDSNMQNKTQKLYRPPHQDPAKEMLMKLGKCFICRQNGHRA
ncbi:hypothetical protein VC83_00676 [Pseudogymnoascus destructans]|uniref:Uncharacterized protein n=1 Tax=Pseudogymnoascus destructans TaxID=655981 RepID=A0A177AKB7_9PEZI|nr:uncharacterized protein VC83_00676 [Pseudogymnoascus destructans]OAF62475.1 hypothetical protein VC83_00676 [Pseudogymnoascus destructans]